jgi:hypothetical protein
VSRISEIEQRLSKRTQGEMKFIAAEFKEDGIVAFEVRMAEPVISFADADFIATRSLRPSLPTGTSEVDTSK